MFRTTQSSHLKNQNVSLVKANQLLTKKSEELSKKIEILKKLLQENESLEKESQALQGQAKETNKAKIESNQKAIEEITDNPASEVNIDLNTFITTKNEIDNLININEQTISKNTKNRISLDALDKEITGRDKDVQAFESVLKKRTERLNHIKAKLEGLITQHNKTSQKMTQNKVKLCMYTHLEKGLPSKK